MDAHRVLVTVVGDLDMATAPALREHLDRELRSGAERLVLDLTRVTFIDSVALATITKARQRLGDPGRLALVVIPDSYATLILRASGVDKIFESFADRDAAMGALYA